MAKKVDTSKPRMFSDEPIKDRLARAQKISDLKNLGPSSEEAFAKAGIKSVKQFVKMGWKKAFKKLVQSDARNRHTIFAYALIGALTNKEWNALSENEKSQAKAYNLSLKPKAKK